MDLAGVEFSQAVESLFCAWLPARSIVAQAIDSRLQVLDILILILIHNAYEYILR